MEDTFLRCTLRERSSPLIIECLQCSADRCASALELKGLAANDRLLPIADPRRAESKKSDGYWCSCFRAEELPVEAPSDPFSLQLLLMRFAIGLHVFPTPLYPGSAATLPVWGGCVPKARQKA